MALDLSLEEVLRKSKKALLIGIGGGGDIVGTIPTARLLEMFGVECILGGLPWERFVYDPVPGPRAFSEIKNLKPLNSTVWFADKDTVTTTGVRFAETEIAELYGKEVLLVDITKGVVGVVDGLRKAMNELRADLLIGIDVGGDSLAFGDEKGLASPLADSIMISAISEIQKEANTFLGVLGYGSDGELEHWELDRSLSIVAKEGGLLGAWGITKEILNELEMVLSRVSTEASRIPVECAKGATGKTTIRRGARMVSLSLISTITFYLSPMVVYEKISKPARLVSGSKSLDEANDALHSIGLFTELDLEREIEEMKIS
ncbi:MAG: DUF1152 domain-containing protein [Candidatus Dadabacteria bacterium]|nr:DUF1152 domain-containing protein [Candidatus Dadabacteria bacterium]